MKQLLQKGYKMLFFLIYKLLRCWMSILDIVRVPKFEVDVCENYTFISKVWTFFELTVLYCIMA